MRTLRAQVTALLVVAVLVVTALANGASFFLTRPEWPPFDEGSKAQDIALLADLAAAVPPATTLPGGRAAFQASPPEGEIDPEATRMLAEGLARLGRKMPVRVFRPGAASQLGPGQLGPGQPGQGRPGPDGPSLTALGLADGRWLVIQRRFGPMAPPSGPPGGTFGFATWLAFMVAGVTAVVVFAVRRLTKPLSLIEEAAGRIGPDGELPVLPEEGPAEVRAAAAAINRLSARLKGAMDSRMRIVAGAAHDLRTPLTRMRLRAEFIPDDEERAQWLSDLEELDRIADSAIRLVREEVEGGPEEIVRLDDLVDGVVAEVAEARRPVRLVHASPAAVRGRPLSLKRAVRNLVVNAATHGGGARVAVSAEAGRVVLLIEDDGPGIPEALMGQVFEPFFRVDPARQVKIPGAGLGLAIANEIVSRHGGRLTLANRPGGGLLQRVDLPGVAVEG
ncbi:ATP-binding protein [Xanthobacter autotrophicus]|uniref:ATP-binding protein n=1 Tax=Xanthobacter autotrophicus TaxID=280 RepID=UPI0024A702F9|nr:ATP-binding protein [Xanthobacter autotrophicus]MDI4658099.1 HAMP domain-containing protein [Xanthobacter autotrophicus]